MGWNPLRREKKKRVLRAAYYCPTCKRSYAGMAAYYCCFCGDKIVWVEEQPDGSWIRVEDEEG